MVTKDQIQRYIDNPCRCLFCRSEDLESQAYIDYVGSQGEQCKVHQQVWCLSCLKKWIEEYQIINVEVMEGD